MTTEWKTRSIRVAALLVVFQTLLAIYALSVLAQSVGIVVSKVVATVTEAGASDSFTVTLGAQPAMAVTLSVTNSATTQVTASPLYLTFTADNWSIAQTVSLTAVADDSADGDATATVTLSVIDATSDDAYDDVSDATVTVTVTDNNTCGVTIVESNGSTMVTEAATTDTFTVALGAQPTSDVVVSVASADTGEATVSPAQLTFTNANWSTTQTVSVTGVDDAVGDGNQTAAVTLAIVDVSSDNCFDPAPDTNVSVTISDDDSAGLTVVETTGSIDVTEAATTTTATTIGNTDTFTVVLNKAPTSDVVVSVESADTGEATVSPTQLTFTNANWSTAQTVTVTGIDDTSIDGTQTTTITLSVVDATSDDTYDPVADHTITATTADNDAVVTTTTTTAPPTTTLPPVATTTIPPSSTPTGPSCDPAPYVDCRGADLSNQVILSTDFTGANLQNANFSGSTVFYGNFRRANMNSANLTWASMVNSDFAQADMRFARLERANLTGAFLCGTDLSYADLYLSTLTNAELPYATLRYANLVAVVAGNAELVRADLTAADLSGANLAECLVTGRVAGRHAAGRQPWDGEAEAG